MPDTEDSDNQTKNVNDELTLKIDALLRSSLGVQTNSMNSENLVLGIKLSGDNYALWATLMKKAIGGRGRGSHITGDPSPPSNTEPAHIHWEQDDQCVFTWLIQNIESRLVNNVSQYPTAKALWDGLPVTYGSGTDSLQIFDLHKRANSLRQGEDTLEECWNKLQNIWMTIDRREPNPMKDSQDIQIYNDKIQEQRLYQLLTAIDEKFELIKRDILKKEPLPSVESAYATIRREAARLQILKGAAHDSDSSAGIGMGLAALNQSGGEKNKTRYDSRGKEDKSKLYCTHCKMRKHTKETCFRLVGYPDWWEDNHKEKSFNKSKSSVAIGNQKGEVDGSQTKNGKAAFGGTAIGVDDMSNGGHSYEGDNWAWY